MRSAIALALLAAGAILTFTVSAQVPGISLRGAGVIIMLTGIAALAMPPSPAADWLRRRAGGGPSALLPGEGPPATGPDDAYPDYLLQDPAVLAAEVLNGIRSDWRQEPEFRPRAGQHHGEPDHWDSHHWDSHHWDSHHGASHHGDSHHGDSHHGASHHGNSRQEAADHAGPRAGADGEGDRRRERARPAAARRTLYSVADLGRRDGVG